MIALLQPLILVIGGVTAFITGFWTGSGVSGVGNIVKYAVVGSILYFVAKQMKWM